MSVKTTMRVTMAIAALAAATGCEVRSSRASGDAPWCQMINEGGGGVYFDCQYRTFDACQAVAGATDHGFCNVNPWPGPATPRAMTSPAHQKRHTAAN
jgi:uncharacterized protein DUF3551